MSSDTNLHQLAQEAGGVSEAANRQRDYARAQVKKHVGEILERTTQDLLFHAIKSYVARLGLKYYEDPLTAKAQSIGSFVSGSTLCTFMEDESTTWDSDSQEGRFVFKIGTSENRAIVVPSILDGGLRGRGLKMIRLIQQRLSDDPDISEIGYIAQAGHALYLSQTEPPAADLL